MSEFSTSTSRSVPMSYPEDFLDDTASVQSTESEMTSDDQKKAEARDFLEVVVKGCHDKDPNARFYTSEDGNILAATASRANKMKFEGRAYANYALYSELEGLQKVVMSPDDRAQLQAIFSKMKSCTLKVKDIRDLHELMDRVARGKCVKKLKVDYAYGALKSHAAIARRAAYNKTITWSDSNNDIAYRHHTITSREGRAEAGRRLAKLFQPVETIVARTKHLDGGEAYADFTHLMSLIKQGKLKSHQLVELYELVEWAKDPAQYARKTLQHLNQLALDAGPDKSITWRDKDMDFKVTNRRNMTRSGRMEASKRLRRALSGLDFGGFDELSRGSALMKKQYKKNWHRLQQGLKSGNLKSTDLVYWHETAERDRDPAGYAIKQLDKLYALAIYGGTNSEFTIDKNSFSFERTDDLSTRTQDNRYRARVVIVWKLWDVMSFIPLNSVEGQKLQHAMSEITKGKVCLQELRTVRAALQQAQSRGEEPNNTVRSQADFLNASEYVEKPLSIMARLKKAMSKSGAVVSDPDTYHKALYGNVRNTQTTAADIQPLKDQVKEVQKPDQAL